MQYLEHFYTKKLLSVYLEFKFNWAYGILPGNSIIDFLDENKSFKFKWKHLMKKG